MSMPKDEIQSEMKHAWNSYMDSLNKSLGLIETQINEAAEMAEICTSEWCEATEHVIDELNDALFSISEPRWADDENSKKLKQLKHRIHDLYAEYRAVAQTGMNQ